MSSYAKTEEEEEEEEGEEGYPRPALGRRPWFALLRRARSLRRFAFAIVGGRLPTDHAYGPPHRVIHRRGSIGRLLGIHVLEPGAAAILQTNAVHGRWLRRPLGLIWLDETGTVIRAEVLAPGGTARCREATWVVETPNTALLPEKGDRVVLLPSSVLCRGP